MRVYFDTNVYSYIAQTGETQAVKHLSSRHRLEILASNYNMGEIQRIPDSDARDKERTVLASVASKCISPPESWHCAEEVRREIGRLRPNWLRPLMFRREKEKVRLFLKNHQEIWKGFNKGQEPDVSSFQLYTQQVESAVKCIRFHQKARRQSKNSGVGILPTSRIPVVDGQARIPQLDGDSNDPEIFWRSDSLQVWYNAIVLLNSSSRDYADWLLPRLREGAFLDESYEPFWMKEVESTRMPRNRLIGLVSFYQLDHKITHGNGIDSLHASHLLDVDLFVTTDLTFAKVLNAVITRHTGFEGKTVLLLNRGEDSAAKQLITHFEEANEVPLPA